MKYYSRDISQQIEKFSKGFPVISVTGPRQSGKTTFLQHQFPGYTYFNLESPQTLDLIEVDPQAFLKENPENIIIDEVQRLPQLLSYIQVHVDQHQKMGSIVLSGSQNLLISEKISQSLAGRAAYQTLYPFSLQELKQHQLDKPSHLSQILTGFYPALYSREIEPRLFFDQYIATYVERDARLIRNIDNLSKFRKFLGLIAGRVGQVLNISSLANDVGIAPNTAEDWISILEASYLVYRLQPYYTNIGKRLIKSPKLYFYDVGLLCALLNLSTETELRQYHNIGSIFENLIISELLKHKNNYAVSTDIYYFRDSRGNEFDVVLDTGNVRIPIEIKSSTTFHKNYVENFSYWRDNINENATGYVIYAGETSQDLEVNTLVSWKNLENVFHLMK